MGADEEMITCQNLEGKLKTQIPWLVVVPVSGSLLATDTGYCALSNHSDVTLSAPVRITISRKSPLPTARLVYYDGVTQKFCYQI